MPISINPIFPVIAAQGAAPDLVLQPGTVIDAEVLKILTNDLVRIAIANLSIEVMSEIPLQVGQTLQLAVSQTDDGIKLAMVGQGAVANQSAPAQTGSGTVIPDLVSPEFIEVAPDVTAAQRPPDASCSKPGLTPLQALAASAAAQSAATKQASLAPLFANLGSVIVSEALPPQLQQAVAQLLALRPRLDQNLGGGEVKAAFQGSGLLLEASLASGRSPPSPGAPDLKAALIVLRQTLQSLGEAIVADGAPVRAAAAPTQPTPTAAIELASAEPAPALPVTAAPAAAPSLLPEIEVDEVLLPQARLPVADDFEKPDRGNQILSAPPPQREGMRAAASATLNLLQEVLQGRAQKPTRPAIDVDISADALPSANPPQRNPHSENATVARTSVPPPPFRGALPSAQPVMPSSLAPDAPLATIVHQLAGEAEAAVARQTLLQVASLPGYSEIAGARTDPAALRWNFEIPFATPAGTAIAQFEISRDGTPAVIDAARRVWRARFSLDVEPAGPVHALISFAEEKTSVRLWAERSGTAAQLRAGTSQLSDALSRAELQPGDIVIRHGAPAQSAAAPAGHFLDRAL